MVTPETYMRRCLQLAELGAGAVAPNPMVGAVLVYNDVIIGEGYHRSYGQAHAEVNCLRDFDDRFVQGQWAGFGFNDREALLERSTLYVSLEPCAHYGKTPPCADMIIARRIPKVVVGVRDPFPSVNGKGIDILRKASVDVQEGVLEGACRELNKRFFVFHTRRRPFIILKWAQSADGMIGRANEEVAISHPWSTLLAHRWRSEEAALLVGRGTALSDDPALTNRHWSGKNPLRLLLDPSLSLPLHLQLFDGSVDTVVFNRVLQEDRPLLHFHRLEEGTDVLASMMSALFKRQVQSVLVEGGGRLLQSFLEQELWDEVRVIRSGSVHIPGGIRAPVMGNGILKQAFDLGEDRISIYDAPRRPKTPGDR